MSHLSCIEHKRRVMFTSRLIHRNDGTSCDTKKVKTLTVGGEPVTMTVVSLASRLGKRTKVREYHRSDGALDYVLEEE